MNVSSIQIFACDHRKNVQWDLPYIRLGNYQSDAALNIKDDEEIAPYQLLLSEGAQMWWVSKHYMELGNPDYIGFCHYRRFFSFAINQPLVNISKEQYQSQLCAKPINILYFIQNKKIDGVTFIPLQVTKQFTDIKSQLKYLTNKDSLNISPDIIDYSFDLLFQYCTDKKLNDALHRSMLNPNTYVCNIFVLKRDLFKTFSNIAFPIFKQIMKCMSTEQLNMTHPRFMGYILERFTSMFLHAFQMLGNKIENIPLITIDAHIHTQWKCPNEC